MREHVSCSKQEKMASGGYECREEKSAKAVSPMREHVSCSKQEKMASAIFECANPKSSPRYS